MTASTADATDLIRARALIARAHAGESIAGVERLAEGLTNAVYRVAPPAVREALSVRVFTTDCESVSKETAVLSAVKGRLPVPDHLAVHAADATLPFASVSYRWRLGLTLNACRRQETAGVLDSLGANRPGRGAARLGAGVRRRSTRGHREHVSLWASVL